MEQSTAQNSLVGMPHAGTSQGVLPADYWNSLDPMYADAQLQGPPPQPQQDATQQAPMGIGWDHPVFQQQQQQSPASRQTPQAQPQQRGHLPPTEQGHGMYSSIPQSWQPNPLHQPLQGYEVSSQYQAPQAPQPPQHMSQFQQGQLPFESRSLTPSESSAFPQYSFPHNYFHPQQIPPQIPSQQPQQQPRQPQNATEFSTPTPQSGLPPYSIPAGYPPELLHNTIDLTNEFPPEPGLSHQTIDPQFLNPGPQVSAQQHGLQHNLLYGNHVNFERNEGGPFNYFQNDFSVQPQPHATNHTMQSSGGAMPLAGLPQPHVVIHTTQKGGPKKQAQSKKAGAKGPKTKSRSGSPSSDESDLEIEAPDEPSPIPATRPNEPVAAAEFDTLQAVWSPRNKRPTADKVKSALVAFKDVIKVLRDAWKDQVQAMKLAENQGDNDKATRLKQEVALQRRIMDKIATTTMDMGHPMIVEKLGEHPMALAAIYSFLADRFQAADFEGSLTINTLKLLARFSTVDEELLLKTNIAKILPRFVKKGGSTVKDLAQRVMDNAAASTRRKQTNKASNHDSPPRGAGADSPSADLAGSKRPRDGDNTIQPATKRMVVTSNLKDAAKPTTGTNGPLKRAVDGATNGKPGNAAAARPRTNIVTPKPTSLFGTLSSASKRPGTTNAERAAAAAAKPTNSKQDEKPTAPPPKPSFSFGDIMADLNKPKETVVAKPTEEGPPETEEERQKRLRKESRRKLRVSWKPDDKLTEIRLFTHDPEEELGPGDGSLRGMGDVKGEGSVLKLHKDIEELEEDDMGGVRETNFYEYHGTSGESKQRTKHMQMQMQMPPRKVLTPAEIEIDNKEMKDANFIKRGGTLQPSSPEKAAQDHRESTTLMVFHTSPADVPPTPKEAPPPDPDEVVPDEVPFGEVPDLVKARQERYYAFVNPKPAAPPAQQYQPAAVAAPGGFDISNLLKIIQSGTQQQSTPPPQPAPQPPAPAPMGDLERTINMFRQQQNPQPPPMPQVPATQPPAQTPDFQNILNVMRQMQPQAPPQPQQTQAAMAPNLGAILSQLSGQNQQGGPPSQQFPNYEDPDRKRMRESQYENQYDSQWARGKRTKANDAKPPKVGLVPCKFWADGKCRKGENCTFRHDM